MNCADLEILLCDYVDGALHGEQKTLVDEHLASCAACAEMAADARGAVEFMQRAADPEPPAALVTKILFELPAVRRAEHKSSDSAWRRFRAKWLEPVLQPRFAMGMAMTVLSFAMLGRFAGIEVRQLKPADLNPVKVWMSVEDRALRTWARAVKYYDSLRVVYEIQSRLHEWNDQAEADRSAKADGEKKNQSGNQNPSDAGGNR
ncbi:MAG: zf-HC2 domain-containing protein [Acidobacteria bacterium]|nr:zf-HC2 domain-containing protein [Acidobacteriota bacterium]